jgi:hypothetical protein
MKWTKLSKNSLLFLAQRKKNNQDPHSSFHVHRDTAAFKVLSIMELLECILSRVGSRRSLANCARVSRTWFDVTIPHLWGELAMINPLLALIGVVKYKKLDVWFGMWVSFIGIDLAFLSPEHHSSRTSSTNQQRMRD